MAHQIHDQSAARALRIRRRHAAARLATRRRTRQRHPQLHQKRQALARVRVGEARRAVDRRNRQSGHRIPQRPAAGTRPHGVLRLRNRRNGEGETPPGHRHHVEQRKGTAGRVPAPLLLPLHQLPRSRNDAGDRRRALSRDQKRTREGSDGHLLRRPQSAGPEEEAVDVGTDRLAETADGRRHSGRNSDEPRSEQGDPAVVRRAGEERAGRAPARTAGVHEPTQQSRLSALVGSNGRSVETC